ncbi:hypothetical protein T492DRAFT_1097875 [Pavlovales sp. CCMP2436]|nr:hypothetical protein T492DRAFT_1097875 [Pavlovales sp. CCMP2436]
MFGSPTARGAPARGDELRELRERLAAAERALYAMLAAKVAAAAVTAAQLRLATCLERWRAASVAPRPAQDHRAAAGKRPSWSQPSKARARAMSAAGEGHAAKVLAEALANAVSTRRPEWAVSSSPAPSLAASARPWTEAGADESNEESDDDSEVKEALYLTPLRAVSIRAAVAVGERLALAHALVQWAWLLAEVDVGSDTDFAASERSAAKGFQ